MKINNLNDLKDQKLRADITVQSKPTKVILDGVTIKLEPVEKTIDGVNVYGYSFLVTNKDLADTLKNLFKDVVDTILKNDQSQ